MQIPLLEIVTGNGRSNLFQNRIFFDSVTDDQILQWLQLSTSKGHFYSIQHYQSIVQPKQPILVFLAIADTLFNIKDTRIYLLKYWGLDVCYNLKCKEF